MKTILSILLLAGCVIHAQAAIVSTKTKNSAIDQAVVNFDFHSANAEQVVQIYSEITGRRHMVSELPALKITVKTDGAVTRAEAEGILNTTLAINNILLIDVGSSSVKPVPCAAWCNSGYAVERAREDAEEWLEVHHASVVWPVDTNSFF